MPIRLLAGLIAIAVLLPLAAAAEDVELQAEAIEDTGPVPASNQFGFALGPADMKARAIGWYAKGCLAGGKMLPTEGPAWQAVRLSRNRNWGHPKLIELIQRFATDMREKEGWPGLLIGDISQPRGGPMLTGHKSHQVGLDADIWFRPMPANILSFEEREELVPLQLAEERGTAVITANWNEGFVRLLKRAASYPEVERIFVHPTIKKALCEAVPEAERGWLAKVRPLFGHNYHFHIRIGCPAGESGCQAQKETGSGDGCGKEVEDWIKVVSRPPKPEPPAEPGAKPVRRRYTTLADLPAACRSVLEANAPATLVKLAAPVGGPIPAPVRKPATMLAQP
jgi:penicillin-insensitive murein endopeptidase